MRTDHPQRGNRFEALRGMRQHVCGGQQPGEILPRLRGKDTQQTEAQQEEQTAEQQDEEQNNSGENNSSYQYVERASYENGESVSLNPSWQYAEHSAINSGCAVMYKATANRKNIVVGVNAGHGTSGGTSVKTLCHPDGSAKTTGGTTGAGATKAVAVSGGMSFNDGTPESSVTLRMAQILKDKLLAAGYDVLMVRDGSDVLLCTGMATD